MFFTPFAGSMLLALSLGQAQPVLGVPKVDGLYYLKHKLSDKFVASDKVVDGGNVFLWGPIPAGHEVRYQFKLMAAGEANHYYLVHAYSGKYLGAGVKNGDRVALAGRIPAGQEANYRFWLADSSEGFYFLYHKASGKAVGAGGGGNDNGAELMLWGPIPDAHVHRYRFQFYKAERSDASDAAFLVGQWEWKANLMTYNADGTFRSSPTFIGRPTTGKWGVKNGKLIEVHEPGANQRVYSYAIEWSGDTFTATDAGGAKRTWTRWTKGK